MCTFVLPSCRKDRKASTRRLRAFTLVELLVVIGIIALLISILLPALNRSRDKARAVQCASNMRQIYLAIAMFAQEHKGRVPRPGFADDSPGVTEVDDTTYWAQEGPGRANVQFGALWQYIQGEAARQSIILCPGDNGETVRYGALQQVPNERNFSYSFHALTMNPRDPGAGLIAPFAQFVQGGRVQPGNKRILGVRLSSIKYASERIYIFEEIGPNDTLCLDPVNNEDDTPSGRHAGQRFLNALRAGNRGSTEYQSWLQNGRGNQCFFDGHVESIPPGDIILKPHPPGNPPNYYLPLW